ncbi:MAG TPA: ATP-binding protein [Polyangiaceae bacterium]|nr:ATP-binding protein [Polyangiaceae bacterium]
MVLSAPERITRLIEVAAALSKTMTPEQVAEVVTTKGLAALGARGGALLRLDDEAGDYILHACADGEPRSVIRLPLGAEAPIAVCARTGRAISAGSQSICLPLLIRGHAIGAIALEFNPGEPLGPEALAFRDATVEQFSQALERSRLYALDRVRREELEHSNRMKDDFLGIVSHELRTPLSAILGWARMLRRGMLTSPKARERALDAIERNANLQARLVDDLLDVSRIVSGKLALDMASVDLGAIVEAAIDSVRPSLLSRGLELFTRIDGERVTILGDPRRLQQVVWNLLTNAIKFTPPGGRIEIVVTRDERTARVAVRDTGIGIPADVLPRIFERFKQADGTATRLYGGLGLGLSIVRHVVESHGGRAAARSEGEGRGAEMVIELPIGETEMPSSTRVGDVDSERARLEGARVLLVDEDDESRELLATALEAEGAELWAVGRVREALATIGSWRPDVIVSDIASREEEGYAFIRAVRALAPDFGGHTPAVALTGLARPTDRLRALSAGFQTHLSKPVDPRELVQVIVRLWPPPREDA